MITLKSKMLLFFLPLLIFACNNESGNDSQLDTDTAREIGIMIPAQACYAGSIGRDSFFLKTERFPNVVTGTLEYKPYEKDHSIGEIDGIINGDTLVADYRFTSEGVQSVAQVVFLLQGDTAIEGYGEKEEKDGKMVFKNLSEVTFDKSVRLSKTVCR